MTLFLQPVPNVPLIQAGDDLTHIIVSKCAEARIQIAEGDIFVLAQKIVSKAEGRLIHLSEVEPSTEAKRLSLETGKDARFVELVLRESSSVLRSRPGLMITEHRLGFVCANAGIDHSNVAGNWGAPDDWVLLLPEDPDGSAAAIQQRLQAEYNVRLGVMVIDSHGRAWRMGTVGTAIGVANVPGLEDLRGKPDLFGYHLRITQIAAADELAAAASLVMGQADEGTPLVHVRGFPYPLRKSGMAELIRNKKLDLFR